MALMLGIDWVLLQVFIRSLVLLIRDIRESKGKKNHRG
jgi:hypothetical protein